MLKYVHEFVYIFFFLEDIVIKGFSTMKLIRIGDKVISREKIDRVVDEILRLRSQGYSQQETANLLGLERTFISRLEGIGEIRKGTKIAVFGFPLKNTEELQKICQEEGVDFTLLMTDEERWQFIEGKSAAELVNLLMELIAAAQQFDTVIMIGSDMRVKVAQAILDREVIGITIGQTPIEEDVYLEPDVLRTAIKSVRGGR